MTGEALALALDLRPAGTPAGDAVLTNPGARAIRVFRPGNSWGDDALTFLVRGGGQAEVALRLLGQDYTRNVPASVEIPPGGEHRIPFDLRDGDWKPADAVDRLAAAEAELAGVFEIPPSRDADEQGVWTGRVQSEFVALAAG
jgi:hypothetical protein